MAFYSNLFNSGSIGSFWRRLSFQHYDPGQLELGFLEQLEGSEYDPRLKERQGVIIFERMSREDSRLATALLLLKEPILAATWQIEASTEGVKRFVEDNLGLSDTPKTKVKWHQILREMLTGIEIGFSLHEITWQLQDEMEHLHAVGFRPQMSVEKFEDDMDYLTGVHQIKQFRPEKVLVRIDAARLMYNAFNRIGNDFWGRSIIRPAYRDWYFKEVLLLISMINAKRYGVPVPHMTASNRVPKKSKDAMANFLMSLTLDQRNHLITSEENKDNPDWKASFLEPERARQVDGLPMIHYFDSNLAKICLVLFLDLGSVSSGNRALGDTFADILYNSLEARCNHIASESTEQLIEPIVRKNFGPGEWAKMTWANLQLNNMERFIEALARLAEVYPVPLTGEDMQRIFEILKMPMREGGFEDIKPDRAQASHNLPGVGAGSGTPSK